MEAIMRERNSNSRMVLRTTAEGGDGFAVVLDFEFLSRPAPPGLSGILCGGPVEPSRLNEPLVEHDGELGLCLEPLAWWHLPLSGGVAQDEKQQLHRGVIGQKMASRAHSAA